MNAPVDVTNIRIETDRLILRAWRETDLADFYEYASVEGVGGDGRVESPPVYGRIPADT